jgi:3-hydroxybutyryl-CoA dehydrogenase
MAGPLDIAVLGAGRMGSALAAEYAAAGHTVRITTSERTSSAEALQRVRLRNDGNGLRVSWHSTSAEAAEGVDVVVESLPEELALKRMQLRLAQRAAPNAILATNTSSLSVGAISEGLDDPSRLVGAHYLNPPDVFAVMELVPSKHSDPVLVDRMEQILIALGKRPVRLLRDTPGFVLNRLQMALLREAVELVDRGVATPEALDRLMTEGLGRRWAAIGPFETIALGGADTFRRVASNIYPELSTKVAPPESISRLRLDEVQVEVLARRRDDVLRLFS